MCLFVGSCVVAFLHPYTLKHTARTSTHPQLVYCSKRNQALQHICPGKSKMPLFLSLQSQSIVRDIVKLQYGMIGSDSDELILHTGKNIAPIETYRGHEIPSAWNPSIPVQHRLACSCRQPIERKRTGSEHCYTSQPAAWSSVEEWIPIEKAFLATRVQSRCIEAQCIGPHRAFRRYAMCLPGPR
jgi:hypothetical protein